MIKKQQLFQFVGMNQDIAETKGNASNALFLKNFRITIDEKNSNLVLTTEKSTLLLNKYNEVSGETGSIVGVCICNNETIILFKITGSGSNITNVIDKYIITDNGLERTKLYSGNLNFNHAYPIQTYFSYENEKTQKIYWIDGINQPRCINIVNTYEQNDTNSDSHFDLCTPIAYLPKVEINKNLNNGSFHSGVIQYFCTFVDLNDQESKIFYNSPLYYITDVDRGLSPEEMGNCSFTINITGISTTYNRKAIRIYSLQRTSLDGIPVAKLLANVSINSNNNISITDTGTIGQTIDAQSLMFLGCEHFIPKTMIVKDNLMFFGNIKINNYGSTSTINNIVNIKNNINVTTEFSAKKIKFRQEESSFYYGLQKEFELNGTKWLWNTYNWSNTDGANSKTSIDTYGTGINGPHNSNFNGSDTEIKGFMYGEEYMLGVQLLHKSGEWSDPIWVCDMIMDKKPSEGYYHEVPDFRGILTGTAKKTLYDNGYIAIRPLVVFNDPENTRVICNGIFDYVVIYDDNMYIPTWHFTPYGGWSDYDAYQWERRIEYNAFISDKENSDSQKFLECPSISNNPSYYFKCEIDNENYTKFAVAKRTATMYSPEFEFEKITKLNPNNIYSIEITHLQSIHHVQYDAEVLSNTTPEGLSNDYGFQKIKGVISYPRWYYSYENNVTQCTPYMFLGKGLWKDTISRFDATAFASATVWARINKGTQAFTTDKDYTYKLYPWHNDVSYSYCPKTEDVIYGAPKQKTITNIFISQHPEDIYNISNKTSNFNINDIQIVNDKFVNFKSSHGTQDASVTYYKEVDILLPSGTSENAGNVRIQYKSVPHAILNVDFGTYELNDTQYKYSWFPENLYHATNTSDNVFEQEYYNILGGYLLNGNYNNSTKFKGRILDGVNYVPTEISMKENTWYVAGNTVSLTNDTTNINIYWTKGDTYYQRYNCLKTYPFSHEAENNFINIFSFMVQTRINIDGTYDKQKNDILHIEPENFNLLNDVYTQKDDFFVYHKIDESKLNNEFKNLIVWGKQKVVGEEIDSWSNIHLINTLDLDGNLGQITSIQLWNNKLIVFQEQGISYIKYNENTLIPAMNNSPIELLSSGKVSGKEILSNMYGCQNKWSIVNTKTGIYFSDDLNKKLFVLNNDGLTCISDLYGFSSYVKEHNYNTEWYSGNLNALHTLYDKVLGDIYFIQNDTCLAFNENLNAFTSFYDYVNVNGYNQTKRIFDFINVNGKRYWILNESSGNVGFFNFYQHHADNNYLNFFGTSKGYSIEFMSNIDPQISKIFDTVEIRGDIYKNNELMSGYDNENILLFDTIQTKNNYQNTGVINLSFLKDKSYSSRSNVKQKLRIWRVAIGRDSTHQRDRICDYWTKIRLDKKPDSNNSIYTKIHDIVVNVYE